MSRRRKTSAAAPPPPADPATPMPAPGRVGVGLALGVGAVLSLLTGWVAEGFTRPLWGLAVGLIVLAFPPVAGLCVRALQWLRNPSPRWRLYIAAGVGIFAGVVLLWTAVYQDRDLIPVWHDEFMQLLQVRMLSEGRLWMPAHPLADFFDTFHVIVEPVYASMYFPGASLLLLPAAIFEFPAWVIVLLASAVCVSLLYLITSELVDGVAGLLAAGMLISLPTFRLVSIQTMASVPLLLLGLAMTWTWLCWRRRGYPLQLAGLVGMFAGWAGITRPIDAICLALPIGLAMLADVRRMPVRKAAVTLAVAIGCGLPFIGLQLVFDKGVTGLCLQTPHAYHAGRDYPFATFGYVKYDPTVRPKSVLPQKQIYFDQFVVPFAREHRAERIGVELPLRLQQVALVALPHAVLLPLTALGLVAALRRPTIPFLAIAIGPAVLFPVLYVFYPIPMDHYILTVIPAWVALTTLGARLPGGFTAAPAFVKSVGPVAIVACALMCFPQTDPAVRDARLNGAELRHIDQALAGIQEDAIVLFRYHPSLPPDIEPVYNIDTAWPDDARIIRAHDLGPDRVPEIIRYYAERQPARVFYLYDRASGTLTRLGSARELFQALPP